MEKNVLSQLVSFARAHASIGMKCKKYSQASIDILYEEYCKDRNLMFILWEEKLIEFKGLEGKEDKLFNIHKIIEQRKFQCWRMISIIQYLMLDKEYEKKECFLHRDQHLGNEKCLFSFFVTECLENNILEELKVALEG